MVKYASVCGIVCLSVASACNFPNQAPKADSKLPAANKSGSAKSDDASVPIADASAPDVGEDEANIKPTQEEPDVSDANGVADGSGDRDASSTNLTSVDFSLARALNWADLDSRQKQYSKYSIDKAQPNGASVLISTSIPVNHLTGLRMQTTPQRLRASLQNSGKPVFVHFELNVAIFTRWNFVGSLGQDSLKFGSQGSIITKQTGGIVDFKADSARDVFEFTNTIDVQKCSEKHGFQCHPLNHLQQVTIKNFGEEDLIILQGKRYKYSDVRNDGTLPEVPSSRLKVEKM